MPDTLLANVTDDVRQRAARIRLACFDVDGVLTDGRLSFDADGRESKSFHSRRARAQAAARLRHRGRADHRARQPDRGAARAPNSDSRTSTRARRTSCARLDALRAARGLGYEQVAFTGDDLPDLSAACSGSGWRSRSANAHPWVMGIGHWCTRLPGGHGAVREVCDLLLAAQGHADAVLRALRGPVMAASGLRERLSRIERTLAGAAVLAVFAALTQWILWLQSEPESADSFIGPPRSDYTLSEFSLAALSTPTAASPSRSRRRA